MYQKRGKLSEKGQVYIMYSR